MEGSIVSNNHSWPRGFNFVTGKFEARSPLPSPTKMVTTRKLCSHDYRSVRDIYHDAFDKEGLPVANLGISWRSRSREHSQGIFDRGNLVGFAIVSLHTSSGTNRYIDYIAVHSAYRGYDYGGKLLNTLLRQCYKDRTGLHLYPLDHKRLRDWYKAKGFHSSGDYYNFHMYGTRRQSPFLLTLSHLSRDS